jgi:hypothetical protein
MSDISLKIRAEALGKTLENLAPLVEEEINAAVRNLAHAAYSAMANRIQQMQIGDESRKNYLKALKFQDLGQDSYLIYLDGEWANKLEKGFGSYSIREQLLKSQKTVGVGSRAGEPWVQKSKDGHKFAHVPFEHRATPAPTGDLAQDIRKMMARGRNGTVQELGKVFKDASGNPMEGKVATVQKGDAGAPNLEGMTKYQYVHPKSGRVSSVYMTYRTVSEHGKDWVHPGHKGYQLFQEAEKFVEQEMDNIIKTLIK